jgi:hypothetical protein
MKMRAFKYAMILAAITTTIATNSLLIGVGAPLILYVLVKGLQEAWAIPPTDE